MTGFLLDTPVLLTILSQKDGFSPALHTVLQDQGVPIYASAASIFEVAVKKATKRIKITDNFPDMILQSGFEILPLEADQAWKILRLPFHHADPFDRMLIAQARCRHLSILTKSPVFESYDVGVQIV